MSCLVYFVKNAAGLLAFRFFLGIVEAGLPVGLSFWGRISAAIEFGGC